MIWSLGVLIQYSGCTLLCILAPNEHRAKAVPVLTPSTTIEITPGPDDTMDVIRDVREMRRWRASERAGDRRVGLVPTMGALHEGHLALVREAARRSDRVVVSVFVNPGQFAPGEDLERYPRTLDADVAALEALSVEGIVFAPSDDAMYPDGVESQRVWIDVTTMNDGLCGRYRPGHFKGVTTVVAKLLHICAPHVACFGLKDAQQFVVIRRMVLDLDMDVEVVGVPTVREGDGLALSSRNIYLKPDERAQAVVLSKAVRAAAEMISGGVRDVATIRDQMQVELDRVPLAEIQYAELVNADTLQTVERIVGGERLLAAVAVHFGGTRLIDNAFEQAPV